ncbi:hypothetical protein FS749_007143 [Ceratobasidium sp. UAMH 11750]|nr:hypothetical protein FS749_007143 [Ceratobasidium sp. UAMH 11750]
MPQPSARSGTGATTATTAAPNRRVIPPMHPESVDEDECRSHSNNNRSEDELGDDLPNTLPGSMHSPAPVPRHTAPPYPPRFPPIPKHPTLIRSRQTRPLLLSKRCICIACPRTDSQSGATARTAPRPCTTPITSNGSANETGRRHATEDNNNPGSNANDHPAPAEVVRLWHAPYIPWAKVGAEIHLILLGGVPIPDDSACNDLVTGNLSGIRLIPGDLAVAGLGHNDTALTPSASPVGGVSNVEVDRPRAQRKLQPTSAFTVDKLESGGNMIMSGLMDLADFAPEKEGDTRVGIAILDPRACSDRA